MMGTPALWLSLIVVVLPVAVWRLTRLPGEGVRQWFSRYEPLDWPAMHQDVLRRVWVSPLWWLKYLYGVVVVTAVIPWSMALFMLVSGQWRHAHAASEMAQVWFELSLVLTVPVFMRIMQTQEPCPRTLSWALLGRCAQVALYALVALQVYGPFVAKTQSAGLNSLVLWRWVP